MITVKKKRNDIVLAIPSGIFMIQLHIMHGPHLPIYLMLGPDLNTVGLLLGSNLSLSGAYPALWKGTYEKSEGLLPSCIGRV